MASKAIHGVIARLQRAVRGTSTTSWVALGLALLAWFTIAAAEPRNGPTCDEYRHVTRGVAALRAPDTRINRPHPPLAQALAMLPVALATQPRFSQLNGWDQANLPHVMSAYIATDYARGRNILRAGRLMNAAWSSALLLFLVAWLRRHYDDVTALAGGALYATCPIILAHAGLVTNDFAVGAFTLLSVAALLSYLEHGGHLRLAVAALAVAALPCVKVSGIVVAALEAFLPVFWLVQRRGAYAQGSWGRAVLRAGVDYAVVALVTLLMINAVYRFELTFLLPGELSSASYLRPGVPLERDGAVPFAFLEHWPRSWRIPVPFQYLKCLNVVDHKNEHGHAGSFFGQRGGSWLYFPFMLATKPQALLLPIVLAGFVVDACAMLRGPTRSLLWVGGGFLAVAMSSHINIGVRHVLPMLMALLVLGGRAAAILLTGLSGWLPRARLPAAGLAGASLLGSVATAFPAFVGDFNIWVGNTRGREAGAVAEDWGQDIADLARELQRRGISRIGYAPRHSFATVDLNYAGISVKRVGCSVKPGAMPAIALHLALWQRSHGCYRALRSREPDFVVHDDILVFLSDAPSPKRKRHRRSALQSPPSAAAPEPTDSSAGAGPSPGTTPEEDSTEAD